jgi:pimeloyl-ACP methyl ester carboxylesterase
MAQLSDQGYFLINGKALEYAYAAGPGSDRPAIVLLHEGLGCCAMWKDFPQRLSGACRTAVLSYSRFGYGRSDSAGLPWRLTYMHDEARNILPQVLDQAGLDDVILMGHSDGASVATIYAGCQPSRHLCGLVLMAPHFFVEDVSISSIKRAKVAYENSDLRSSLERYHGINTDEAFYGWNTSWLDTGFRSWDITSFIEQINVPVLALQGRDDEYGTPAQLDALELGCQSPYDVRLFNNCGHSPHRDQPILTLAAVADFIAQL